MSLTKAQVRSAIRALMPDQLKQQWSDSSLDVITSLTIDELWSEILIHAPWFLSNRETILAANIGNPGGYVSMTVANGVTQRFFKMQKVVRGSQQFGFVDPQDNLLTAGNTVETVSTPFSYYIKGYTLYMNPIDYTTDVDIMYSYLPVAFTTLAETDTMVNNKWPDGLEGAIIYEVVARVQTDTQRMANYHAIALSSFDRVLNRVKREGGGAARMGATDDLIEWGGI